VGRFGMGPDLFQSLQALERWDEILKAMKQAKSRGVDLKAFQPQTKEWMQAFRSGDYDRADSIADRILEAITGVPSPPS
jgi:hypothetical protein